MKSLRPGPTADQLPPKFSGNARLIIRHCANAWTLFPRFARRGRPSGAGALQALATFSTNPAGAAIVNAVGPIRQIVHGDAGAARRYLIIVAGSASQPGKLVQIQAQ
jgi:hypothetical protein